eukprot:Gb_26457 [translate_table: standard]
MRGANGILSWYAFGTESSMSFQDGEIISFCKADLYPCLQISIPIPSRPKRWASSQLQKGGSLSGWTLYASLTVNSVIYQASLGVAGSHLYCNLAISIQKDGRQQYNAFGTADNLILWPESGWQPVSLTDVITAAAVKKVYRKATLCVHPDKVQQKGATIQQKYIAEKVFDLLKSCKGVGSALQHLNSHPWILYDPSSSVLAS